MTDDKKEDYALKIETPRGDIVTFDEKALKQLKEEISKIDGDSSSTSTDSLNGNVTGSSTPKAGGEPPKNQLPTAATIYADDSFPTPEPSLRIRAEWENVNVSEGDELVRRKDVVEKLEKCRKKSLEGRQMDGQEFLNADEQSGYEAALYDFKEAMQEG